MPTKAPTACRRPGCRGLVRGGVCSVCGAIKQESNWRKYFEDRNSQSRHERGYGWNWEKLRSLVLSSDPFCRQCAAHGIVEIATTVDHIIPKSAGGDDDTDNLQPLCAACHRDKTVREVRGRLRRSTIPVTVVAGPPGSGKSTWLAARIQPDDLMIDVDALYGALCGLPMYDARRVRLLPFVLDARHAILLRLARTSSVRRAWVVTTESDARTLQQMVDDLGATLVVLAVPAAECLARIAVDVRRIDSAIDWPVIVDRWWQTWRTTGGEAVSASGEGAIASCQ